VNSISVMTFSKDRGPQLHALLKSIDDHVMGYENYYILYTFSDDRNKLIYDKLIVEYGDRFTFIRETHGFYRGVLDFLGKEICDVVMFTPDDGLYIRPINLEDLAGYDMEKYTPSIRLGPHLRKCHPVGNVDQPYPPFKRNSHMLLWPWDSGVLDWGYPLALDGHMFSRTEMLKMVSSIQFKSPTSFETGIQKFRGKWNRSGVCYMQSRFVSLPWNVVTQEVNNVNGEISHDEFLSEWESGNQICVDHIYNTEPVSCHQEYKLEWENRED
jgi:hypothetical protein